MIAPIEDPNWDRKPDPKFHLSQTMLRNLEALELPINELKDRIQRELEDQEGQ